MNTVHLVDCNEFMRTVPDKHYDLAIVDPPYGIGEIWSKSRKDQFYRHKSSYKNDQSQKPSKEYFDHLFRISKNQVVWGYNYFAHLLPESNNLIVWDKVRDCTKTYMSEAELAWHSFSHPVRIFQHQWDGAKKESETGIQKIHPFQKPIGLYTWILKEYAKPGQRIFDSHVGSGSIRIAAYELGFDFEGCELDPGYYADQLQRFKEHCKQKKLFPTKKQIEIQEKMRQS